MVNNNKSWIELCKQVCTEAPGRSELKILNNLFLASQVPCCFPKRQLSSATSASYKTWKNLGPGQDHFQITKSGSGGRDHEYWSRQELDSVTVSQTPTVTMTAGQCSDSQHPSSVTSGVRLATCQLQVDRVFACSPTGKTGSQAPQWKAIYTNIAWKCYIQHG